MRFVLPHSPEDPGRLVRLGLFLYDHLGGRKARRARVLNCARPRWPLLDKYARGFEYSDCWVDDARSWC